jgi:hypothetical protein
MSILVLEILISIDRWMRLSPRQNQNVTITIAIYQLRRAGTRRHEAAEMDLKAVLIISNFPKRFR